MGIFSSIKNAIWSDDEDDKAAAAPAPAAEAAPAAPERAAISEVDVVARVSSIPGADKLNWQTSIVDLMKLLNLDSSYGNRKELAGEVGIDGYSGSAEDNIALHKAVMTKLAEAGGIVPDDLKD
ncbi:MAG: DUF3597 domain-containing protein [Pseudomonadota bacterium]